MCLIVMCHFFQYYGSELAWWFNVGVQIFFVVSGFLYSEKEIVEPITFIKKQFTKILIPYYTFLILVIGIYLIFARDALSVITVVKTLFCSGTISGMEHLWFVGYILFCYLITPYLYWIKIALSKLQIHNFIITVSLVLILAIITSSLFDLYFHPARISCYIIGYIIGDLYHKYGQNILKKMGVASIFVAVVTNSIRIYFRYVNPFEDGSFALKLFKLVEPYTHMMLGIALFLLMYIIFGSMKHNKLLDMSNRYSYYIYLVHQLFILSPFNLMKITSVAYINWIIIIFACILFATILYFISNSIFRISKKLVHESTMKKYVGT